MWINVNSKGVYRQIVQVVVYIVYMLLGCEDAPAIIVDRSRSIR